MCVIYELQESKTIQRNEQFEQKNRMPLLSFCGNEKYINEFIEKWLKLTIIHLRF